jgi:hypothetical protein
MTILRSEAIFEEKAKQRDLLVIYMDLSSMSRLMGRSIPTHAADA